MLPGVAQLGGPDLEDLRRRGEAVAAALRGGLEVGPVVHRPVDRHLDQGPLAAPARALGDGVAVAGADPVEPGVVGHQRRVVAEPGRLDELQRPRAKRPVRRPPAGRRGSAARRRQRLEAPAQDVALLVHGQLREVLVVPAVRRELVAALDDRGDRLRERLERVAGHEPGRRDPPRREQREDPRRADPRPELAVRDLDRRVAAPDPVGDRVVVEGQRDGQTGPAPDVSSSSSADRSRAVAANRPWAAAPGRASSGRRAGGRRRSTRHPGTRR